MRINKKFQWIDKGLIDGGFIQDIHVGVTVLDHVRQQVSEMGYVNKPGRYSKDSDGSIVDLIAMASTEHAWLVALRVSLACIAIFLLYSNTIFSSKSHPAIIAVTIGYSALAGSLLKTSHAFKNPEK